MTKSKKRQNTLKYHCNTAEDLEAYLRLKGKNHNYYKCYAPLKRVIDIRDSRKLYLSNGKNWNDTVDSGNFNSENRSFMNFGRSFSFSQEESVAMWMLYGGIHDLGGMIDFTKKGINSILDVETIQVGYFDKESEKFQPTRQLDRKDFEIYVTDIVYYKKNGKGYYINRSDEAYPCLSQEVFNKLTGCQKTYPWHYENECRLIVSINKKLLDNNSTTVQIDLENLNLGVSLNRIYHSPNYALENTYRSSESKLKGTINWSLCDRQCKYRCEAYLNGRNGGTNANI